VKAAVLITPLKLELRDVSPPASVGAEILRPGGRFILAGLKGGETETLLRSDELAFRKITVEGVLSAGWETTEVATRLLALRKYPLAETCTHGFRLAGADRAVRSPSSPRPEAAGAGSRPQAGHLRPGGRARGPRHQAGRPVGCRCHDGLPVGAPARATPPDEARGPHCVPPREDARRMGPEPGGGPR
jgi:hypothetical protein